MILLRSPNIAWIKFDSQTSEFFFVKVYERVLCCTLLLHLESSNIVPSDNFGTNDVIVLRAFIFLRNGGICVFNEHILIEMLSTEKRKHEVALQPVRSVFRTISIFSRKCRSSP